MKSIHKEATVGLLVIIGVVGFIAGGMWLRGKALGNPPTVRIAYPNVETLKEGSPVSVSGAVVGRVETIVLDRPGRVIVMITYDDDKITPTVNSTSTLVGVGMLGDMAIEFDPGTGAPLPADQVIEGTVKGGLLQLGDELASRANATLDALNRMLDTTLVIELRRALVSSRRMMDYFADPRNGPAAEVGSTMAQLRAVSARLDTAIAGVDAAGLSARVDTTMRQAGEASMRLASLSARMDTLLTRIDRGEGTIGKLMSDTALYGELTRTIHATSALVDSLAAHPEKVGITVKIF